jgi:hypothetical protein
MTIAATRGATVRFDYSGLPDEAVQSLRLSVKAIHAIQREAYIEIGNYLLAAKELLSHGSFGPWLQFESGMSMRSAQNYMNAARFVERKRATVALLPPAIVYALAAPSGPQDVLGLELDDAEDFTPPSRRGAGSYI